MSHNSDENFLHSEIEEYLKVFTFTEEEDSESIKLYKELESKYQPQVIASLERNGVNLELQGNEIIIDWDSKNIELTEKRYLATKLSMGLIELGIGSEDLIIEAIASIGANYTINTADKEGYFEAIHDILGTEVFNNIIAKVHSKDILDEVFKKEKQINNLSKYSYIVSSTVESFLKKAGISENHDDFDGFCNEFTRLVLMSDVSKSDDLKDPIFQNLQDRIKRLGIENKIDELWSIFDLEDD